MPAHPSPAPGSWESGQNQPPRSLPCHVVWVGSWQQTERQTKGMRPPARSTTDVPRPGGCRKPGQTRARNPGSQTGLKQWQRNLLHSGCQLGNRCVNRVEFLLRLQRRVLPARLALAAPGGHMALVSAPSRHSCPPPCLHSISRGKWPRVVPRPAQTEPAAHGSQPLARQHSWGHVLLESPSPEPELGCAGLRPALLTSRDQRGEMLAGRCTQSSPAAPF